jgi:hypothetical protein
MEPFNWHSGRRTHATPLTGADRNVRRCLQAPCSNAFRFDRPFMAGPIDGTAKTMGDAAGETPSCHPPAAP